MALGTGIGVMHAFPQDALPANIVVRRFRPRIPFSYAMITQDDDTRSAAVAQFGETLRTVARTLHRTHRPGRPGR